MKLSRKSIAYRTASRFGAALFFILIFAGPVGLVLFLPLLAVVTAYEYLYWKKYDFFIENGDIKITSGVLTRNALDIPVRRIQNVDINRNIIHRIFDIAELRIETAGGSTTEASLRYLDLGDAEKLRDEIRQLKDRRRDSSEQETEEDTDEKSYSLSDKNLAILSLTSSAPSTAIISILLFFSAVSGTVFYAESVVELVGGLIASLAGVAGVTAILLALGGLGTFSKYYGFTVNRNNDTIEYEMGLINRQGGTIPKEKIQTLVIEENFLKRYLGYATLKVETAGANIEEQFNSSTVLIPLDKREKIVDYMEHTGNFKTPEMQKIDRKAEKRYMHRYLVISGILALPVIGLITAGVSPVLILIPALFAVASSKAASLKWKNIGYSLGESHAFTMKGFWKRKTYAVPYFRFQNLMKTESVFQRRWNQASITIDTAGSIWTNPVIPDMDTEKADKVRAELYSRFRNSVY